MSRLPWIVTLPCTHPLIVVLGETSVLQGIRISVSQREDQRGNTHEGVQHLSSPSSTADGLLVNLSTPNGFTRSDSSTVSFAVVCVSTAPVCNTSSMWVPPRNVRAAQHRGLRSGHSSPCRESPPSAIRPSRFGPSPAAALPEREYSNQFVTTTGVGGGESFARRQTR